MEPDATGLKVRFFISIDESCCKQCGICVYFCPKNVLDSDWGGYVYVKRAEVCIGCQLCYLHCPDFALEVIDLEC